MNHYTPQQIEQAAERHGLKMAEVCRRADISFQTFWNWKNKKTRISLENYERLVKAAEADKK